MIDKILNEEVEKTKRKIKPFDLFIDKLVEDHFEWEEEESQERHTTDEKPS